MWTPLKGLVAFFPSVLAKLVFLGSDGAGLMPIMRAQPE
jgi:hypothetical protein